MIDPQMQAVAANKAINTLFFIRRIHRLRDKVLKIIGSDNNTNNTMSQQPRPMKMPKTKNPFPIIGACLVMFFLSSCATTQTAVIPCGEIKTTEQCIRDNLGQDITIVRVSKIDNGLYIVDYK